jgi:hypothetical protein
MECTLRRGFALKKNRNTLHMVPNGVHDDRKHEANASGAIEWGHGQVGRCRSRLCPTVDDDDHHRNNGKDSDRAGHAKRVYA